MSDKEDRQAKRKAVKSVLEVSEPDGGVLKGVGRLRDVSDTGCSVETSLKLAVAQEIHISLFSSDGKSTMDLVATVMWQKESGAKKVSGLRFSPLTPAQLTTLQDLFQDD